jgi:hypothetical protein
MENLDPKRLLSAIGFTEHSYDPSLEEFVQRAGVGVKCDQHKITVNRCPELIRSTVIALRHKHKKLTSQAAVTRCLTEQGIKILQKLPGIKGLKERKKQAYESGNERDRLILSKNIYDLGYRMSMTTQKITVYSEEWVCAAITELACDIGTSQETVAIMTLITGAVTSKEWIPDRHLRLMLCELICFATWVEGLSICNNPLPVNPELPLKNITSL